MDKKNKYIYHNLIPRLRIIWYASVNQCSGFIHWFLYGLRVQLSHSLLIWEGKKCFNFIQRRTSSGAFYILYKFTNTIQSIFGK